MNELTGAELSPKSPDAHLKELDRCAGYAKAISVLCRTHECKSKFADAEIPEAASTLAGKLSAILNDLRSLLHEEYVRANTPKQIVIELD